jgi:hypothetical protein
MYVWNFDLENAGLHVSCKSNDAFLGFELKENASFLESHQQVCTFIRCSVRRAITRNPCMIQY